MELHDLHADSFVAVKSGRGRVRAKALALAGLLMLCVPCTGDAQDGDWYVSPYLGGITPDKPWGGTGSAGVLGIDLGRQLSAAWSAELDFDEATLADRFGPGRIHLYGAALELRRSFTIASGLAPYVSLGAGVTRLAPPNDSFPERRTEFMMQPGAGALIRLWESSDHSCALALRPDIRLRWTHGWAHAPGNPVDLLYVFGLTMSF
jgi:hypothetical protein